MSCASNGNIFSTNKTKAMGSWVSFLKQEKIPKYPDVVDQINKDKIKLELDAILVMTALILDYKNAQNKTQLLRDADINKDGKYSKDELTKHIKERKLLAKYDWDESYLDSVVEHLWNKHDTNNDDIITKEELINTYFKREKN